MDTFRDYILGSIVLQEAEWQEVKEANRLRFGRDDAHLINKDYGREATKEEKKAIKYRIALEVRGMQKALKDAGEKPLSLSDVRHYWKYAYEEKTATADLLREAKWYKGIKNHRCPKLVQEFLVEEKAAKQTVGWKAMLDLRQASKQTPDRFTQLMRGDLEAYRKGSR